MTSLRFNSRKFVVALAALGLLAIVSPDLPSASAMKELTMQVRGTNGYRVTVDAFDSLVSLTARKGNASVQYTVRGRATGRRVEANFGSLGRISVGFRGRLRRYSHDVSGDADDCTKSGQDGKGAFVGTIRFQGEDGFFSISTKRAKGKIRTVNFKCRGEGGRRVRSRPMAASSGSDPSFRTVLVVAHVEENRGTAVQFDRLVHKLPAGGEQVFWAYATALQTENRGRVEITREAELDPTDSKSLSESPLSQQVVTATLALPEPFAGSAVYTEAPGSGPSWTGDLAVDLPGAGAVPLVGPGFKPAFCSGPDEKLEKCTEQAFGLYLDAYLAPLDF